MVKIGANVQVAPRTVGSPQVSPGTSGSQAVVAPKLKLVVVRGQVGAGSSFKLGASACTAGRSKGLLLFPNDNFVAPLHATFFFREGKLFVRDENTPSGTFVTVSKELIPAGTFFAVGDTLLRYLGPLPAAASSQVAHYGAPLPPGPMYLVEEVLEGLRPGRCMARPGPTVAVGQAGCEFLVADAMVSPRHCELTFNPQGATLRDLGSQTGTFVRIAPGAERALSPGDQVRLGNEILRVEAV
jgi:pSer/pThr/pTyr-binding forkhead associated (FHA) protein